MTDQNGCLFHGRGQAGDPCTCPDRHEPTPPPAKCIVCGRTSRIAGLIGSDVCSPACGWMDSGASAERERIVAWLRSRSGAQWAASTRSRNARRRQELDDESLLAASLASAIERGEHREDT